MSTKKKKRPLHHQLAYNYFLKLQADKPFPEDAHHILNAKELAWIARIRRKALLLAGTYGAVAVLTYYIPIYIFPGFFEGPEAILPIKLLGLEIDFNWI